jgi:glycyl-tRNA synthetase beta chain
MGELLLELLSEEIPAGMQRRAIEDFCALVRDKLATADIAAKTLRGYVTPRRLTVIADGIPERQPDRSEERRGPRVGAPQQALDGFLRAAGLQSIEQCEIRDTGRGEFYFAVTERPGAPTGIVLLQLLRAVVNEMSWPKSMRFPASSLRWVRPLTSALCLFDGAIVQFPFDGMFAGHMSRGHRFLSEGEIAVDNAADYLDKLEAAHVILDQDRRRDLIGAELDRLAAAQGLTVKPDPALLDEVTGLVEYPVVLMGRIDDEFVRPLPEGLPPEVRATAMRTHQKYFSCLKADGSPAPRFLFVANNLTADHGKTIIAGNERVLRARLADARFFWDQDRKVRLEDRVEALKDRVYHEKLGTMFDKIERMEKLAGFLADQLYPVTPAQAGAQRNRLGSEPLDTRFRGNDDAEVASLAQRAAHLCKADLSTGMVGEFPELQGAMGQYYALNDGEDPRVAQAIADHYKPLGPNDTCPTAPVSVVVALADKLDSLAAFFAINEKPTGSRDPFALRRAALGVIRLVLERQLRLPMLSSLKRAALEFTGDRNAIAHDVFNFMVERLSIELRGQGLRYDIIETSLRSGDLRAQPPYRTIDRLEQDFTRLQRRARAVDSFATSDDGANLLTAYRRAANIVAIEKNNGGWEPGPVDPSLLREHEETRLHRALSGVEANSAAALVGEDFVHAMSYLARLRRPVDEFFDKVTVNTDAEEGRLRQNRLRFLSRIQFVMDRVADFSRIEG